jgi:hypothetical protein
MTASVQGLRNAADFMKQQSGVDPLWLRNAADEIELMRKALQLQEKAEKFHMECEECDPEDAPETCEECFPLYDDARVARRAILCPSLTSPNLGCK